MNTTSIWIMQGILAFTMAASGLVILIVPKSTLEKRLSWVKKYPNSMRIFICVAKILAAIGLIAPLLLNILPILTPIEALGIVLLMIAALNYHLQTKEYKDVPATGIFLAMGLLISYYRF